MSDTATTPTTAPITAPSETTAPVVTTTEAPAATTIAVDIDAGDLKKWSKLQADNRAAKARIKALEVETAEIPGLKTTAGKTAALEAHVKEGKMLAAAKAAGIDIEAAFSEWLATDGVIAEPAGPSPEVEAVKAELAKVTKRLEDDDKARKDETDKVSQVEREENTRKVSKYTTDLIASDSARWARCAKEPDAVKDANITANLAWQKLSDADRTDEQAAALLQGALDQLEAHYTALGERYFIVEAPPPNSRSVGTRRTPRAIDSSERRTSPTIDNNRGTSFHRDAEPKKQLTSKEAKAKILKQLRSGG